MVERALRAVVEYRSTPISSGLAGDYAQHGTGRPAGRPLCRPSRDRRDADSWKDSHAALVTAPPELREELARIVLDEFRRVLAIDVDCLTQPGFERIQRESRQHLRDPWLINDSNAPRSWERHRTARVAGAQRSDLNLSGRSALGRYLRRPQVLGPTLKADDAQAVIISLLGVLGSVGTLTEVVTDSAGNAGYRLKASSIRWTLGDGAHGADDPLRRQFDSETLARVNPFFRDLYRDGGLGLAGLYAREHTAQVPPGLREEREGEFRSATLPLLYCSPTMELGVDIASLSAVSMRNVPPTPANYAQRSDGPPPRPARHRDHVLLQRECSRQLLVPTQPGHGVGISCTPRLDLGNEELVRSHVHAVWLAETGQSMRSSLTEVLDMAGDEPSLTFLPDVWRP